MADGTETDPPEGAQEARLDKLEATQEQQGSTLDRIEAALAKLVPGSHAEAEDRAESRLDRGSSVEEQVKAELARAKQEQDEAAAKASRDAEHEDVKTRVARLEEKPPQPPVRRATKLLGWGS